MQFFFVNFKSSTGKLFRISIKINSSRGVSSNVINYPTEISQVGIKFFKNLNLLTTKMV